MTPKPTPTLSALIEQNIRLIAALEEARQAQKEAKAYLRRTPGIASDAVVDLAEKLDHSIRTIEKLTRP
jgi:hypothetical protein